VAEERLPQVGLWETLKDRLNDSPFRLSGGQQQLLCFARALAVGPEVLLLDEPTSALDPISTELVEDLLRQLTPGITLIIVTHNLGQARRASQNTKFSTTDTWSSTARPKSCSSTPKKSAPSITSPDGWVDDAPGRRRLLERTHLARSPSTRTEAPFLTRGRTQKEDP
jgi:ABC-type phosphate transport system ATPase subunit